MFGPKIGLLGKIDVLKGLLGRKGAFGSKMELLGKIDFLQGFLCKKYIWVKNGLLGNIDLHFIHNTDLQSLSARTIFPKSHTFNPSGHFSLKAPFYVSNPLRTSIFPINSNFNPDTSFYPKIPSGHQFSIKAPLSTQLPLLFPTFPSAPQIFPKAPILNPNAPFLPNNLFRTSSFP